MAAASDVLDVPTAEILRWFGRDALPQLAQRYPQLFTAHSDTRSFVLTLNEIIHPEVRKLYPGAITPEFDFDAAAPDELGMTYRSPRRLCALAEGLLQGAADHYGERVEIAQPQCMHRGDAECRLLISFHR